MTSFDAPQRLTEEERTAPLTNRERVLLEGFMWYRNITHQAHGGGPVADCPYKTCHWATGVIDRAAVVDRGLLAEDGGATVQTTD